MIHECIPKAPKAALLTLTRLVEVHHVESGGVSRRVVAVGRAQLHARAQPVPVVPVPMMERGAKVRLAGVAMVSMGSHGVTGGPVTEQGLGQWVRARDGVPPL